MKPLGRTKVHFWLAQRMAKATETDLVQAMNKAQLTQEDWAEMVWDCRDCDWTKGCKRWLAVQEGSFEKAPEPCVNRERFAALKAALEELEE